ncbi:hypothetical protein BHS06_24845 [Myxococcus xanthus]|nr:hypothetical protein BHS06_24845 [Myxococcus xanthus]
MGSRFIPHDDMGIIRDSTARFGADQRRGRRGALRQLAIEFDGGVPGNITVTQDTSIRYGATLHDEDATGLQIVEFDEVLPRHLDTSKQLIELIELRPQSPRGLHRGRRIGLIESVDALERQSRCIQRGRAEIDWSLSLPESVTAPC